jgi:hypothetical protein
MANWSLLRAFGWALKSRLWHYEMEAFDDWNTKVPNFTEGSSHSTSGDVVLDGLAGTKLWVKTGFRADKATIITFGDDGGLTMQGSSGHLAAILIKSFSFIGVDTGGTVVWGDGSTGIVQSGATFNVQSDGLLQVDSGASFTVGCQADILSGGKWRALSGAKFQVLSGATLEVLAGGVSTNASVLGVQLTGTQPASTADPGATSAISKNQCKAWANMTIGGGAVAVLDGINIASVGLTGAGLDEVQVTFAGAMADAHYSVTWGIENDTTFALPVVNGTKTTGGFNFNLWDIVGGGVLIDLATASARKVSFQVQGKR